MEPAVGAPGETVPWVVVSADRRASEAGAAVLARGGNAIDAAITVQTVLGLVEPQSSGLGGGAFMLYYDASSKAVKAYDGREVAPFSAAPDMFLQEDGTPMPFYDAVTSGLSVGVPGAVAMLSLAHAEHGVLEWSSLFAPAETLARDGFQVSPRLNYLLGRFTKFAETEAANATYYTADGEPLAEGATVLNTAYADTVRAIAEGGAAAFYTGEIAEQIVAAVNAKAGEGTMTLEDLASYQPTKRRPVCLVALAHEICSMGPPSSGGVTVLQILSLFEQSMGDTDAPSAEAWAKYLEASRLAFADRNHYLADPSAMGGEGVDARDIVEGLISAPYLADRATLIGDSAAETVEHGDPLANGFNDERAADASPELPGTSHFSIRDSQGNVVSMTTTVEFAFGSHLMAGGFVLNNQLTDFSFVPEVDGVPVANAAAPGKKPRSSMAPVIVLDEDRNPVIAIGSPGGPAIIGYVAQTLIGALDWDMDLQAAVDMPRLVAPRGSVIAEEGMDPTMVTALEDFGYDVTVRELTSGLNGFRLSGDDISIAADTRREGYGMMAE